MSRGNPNIVEYGRRARLATAPAKALRSLVADAAAVTALARRAAVDAGAVRRVLSLVPEHIDASMSRAYLEGGRTLAQVAAEYGCSTRHVLNVLRREGHSSRGRVPPRHPSGARHPRARLADEQVAEVRKRLKDGETVAAVARRYGVSRSHVYAIKSGRARLPGPKPKRTAH